MLLSGVNLHQAQYNVMEQPSSLLKTSYISYFENAIDSKLCSTIINYYEKNAKWQASTFSTSTGISPITKKQVSMSDFWIGPELKYYKHLKESFVNCVNKYTKQHPRVIPENFTRFRMNRYSVGGYMKSHIDNIHHSHGQQFGYPHITALLFLNDDYDGGDFILCDGEYEVPKKKGSCIIFPSNFMYPHEVKYVSKGIRYSVMTWIV